MVVVIITKSTTSSIRSARLGGLLCVTSAGGVDVSIVNNRLDCLVVGCVTITVCVLRMRPWITLLVCVALRVCTITVRILTVEIRLVRMILVDVAPKGGWRDGVASPSFRSCYPVSGCTGRFRVVRVRSRIVTRGIRSKGVGVGRPLTPPKNDCSIAVRTFRRRTQPNLLYPLITLLFYHLPPAPPTFLLFFFCYLFPPKPCK